FQRLLHTLAEHPHERAQARVGYRQASHHCEWLLRDFSLAPPGAQEPVFQVVLASHPPSAPLTELSAELPGGVGWLSLEDGPGGLQLSGAVRSRGGALEPLQYL